MKPLRPYLYHAYYQWILDNDCTPYLLVDSEYPDVDVPQEFVQNGKIILNIAPRAIGQYEVDDNAIHFSARFQGILRDVYIPFGSIVALYAQELEDGGIVFPDEKHYQDLVEKMENKTESDPAPTRKAGHLKLVK